MLSQAGGADGVELPDAHVAGDSRQVRAAEHPRHAPAAAAGGRAAARPIRRRRPMLDARAAEVHRANPICAACHRNMDPLGFGLENYDAIGRVAGRRRRFPVDASGTLPDGQRFRRPERCGHSCSRNCRSSRDADRQDADLRSAARSQAVRPPHGGRHSSRRRRRRLPLRTMVHQIVASLPFQSAGAAKTQPRAR